MGIYFDVYIVIYVQLDAAKAQLSQVEGAKDAEISSLKASVREFQRELAEKSRLAARAKKEV